MFLFFLCVFVVFFLFIIIIIIVIIIIIILGALCFGFWFLKKAGLKAFVYVFLMMMLVTMKDFIQVF